MDNLINILSEMNIDCLFISEEEFNSLPSIIQETYLFNLRSINDFFKDKLHKM